MKTQQQEELHTREAKKKAQQETDAKIRRALTRTREQRETEVQRRMEVSATSKQIMSRATLEQGFEQMLLTDASDNTEQSWLVEKKRDWAFEAERRKREMDHKNAEHVAAQAHKEHTHARSHSAWLAWQEERQERETIRQDEELRLSQSWKKAHTRIFLKHKELEERRMEDRSMHARGDMERWWDQTGYDQVMYNNFWRKRQVLIGQDAERRR